MIVISQIDFQPLVIGPVIFRVIIDLHFLPFPKSATKGLQNQVKIEAAAAHRDGGEAQLRDRLGNVLQRGDDLVVLPVDVGLVGEGDGQGEADKEHEKPEQSVA